MERFRISWSDINVQVLLRKTTTLKKAPSFRVKLIKWNTLDFKSTVLFWDFIVAVHYFLVEPVAETCTFFCSSGQSDVLGRTQHSLLVSLAQSLASVEVSKAKYKPTKYYKPQLFSCPCRKGGWTAWSSTATKLTAGRRWYTGHLSFPSPATYKPVIYAPDKWCTRGKYRLTCKTSTVTKDQQ